VAAPRLDVDRHPESHREAVLLQEIAAAGQRGRCRPAAAQNDGCR